MTRRGEAAVAVLVPVAEWRRLQRSARPTLKELLLAEAPRVEIVLPAQGRDDRVIEDALIAATAQVHGLTVVTRHVRDYRPFDVTALDPFAAR